MNSPGFLFGWAFFIIAVADDLTQYWYSPAAPPGAFSLAFSQNASFRTLHGHVDGQPAECDLHNIFFADLFNRGIGLSGIGVCCTFCDRNKIPDNTCRTFKHSMG